MHSTQLARIQHYVEQHALALDLAIHDFHFRGASAKHVIDELEKWQNKDGGFRGSLEHDARLPQSTAIATWTALRIMREIGIDRDAPILRRSLTYLINSYDREHTGWSIVCPEVDAYPHAPWWTYKTAMANFGWGNPSAELLGFFVAYGGTEATNIVPALRHRAVARIRELDESADFHEVLTFKGLYEMADTQLREQLQGPLEHLIKASSTLQPTDWQTYSAPPLKFVNSPDDPFVRLFDPDLIKKNLTFLEESLAGDHWEPNWDWDGTYPEAWPEAKREWSSQITVKNLITLKNFGLIKKQDT